MALADYKAGVQILAQAVHEELLALEHFRQILNNSCWFMPVADYCVVQCFWEVTVYCRRLEEYISSK